MKINKTWKVIIGLATLWVVLFPFIVMIGMFAIILPTSIAAENYGNDVPPMFMGGFLIFIALMMFSSFLQMGTSGFYLVHVIKNKQGLDLLKIILGIGIFYLPYIAMPVYYFIYIWPDVYPDWALEKSTDVK